ncbi:MAG TPA: beta-galactosidase [Candidatus Acidoferrum sp.]|nr:beta-galactosidase [Candidatus Acidoferrum sp.]
MKQAGALAGVALTTMTGMRLPAWAGRLQETARGSLIVPLLFGVDYYPDQTPEALWEEDARMIAEAGLTNVRIAEFAWSLMEPSEGHFDFGWLHKAAGILHKHGIAVFLGTPSAAPPPWLTQKYPEVLMVNDQGMTVMPGGRRFTCPSNRAYRKLSLTIATEMAKAFANEPGVIGWQIDNEFTLQKWGRCYCKACRAGFADWLREKYGSLESVNSKWGTAFWSQVYTEWNQIPVPLPSNGDPNPGLALDYDRYQSFANASACNEQAVMVRKLCPKHLVTTNSVGAPFDTISMRELFKELDFVSSDNYPGFVQLYLGDAPAETLASVISLGHDSMRGAKNGKPFLIMEEQSGKAGQAYFAPQPHKGQLRLWTYQAVAHGAMGVNYFRWDSAKFGAEEYWHGLLNHDRSKSPGFEEIAGSVKELKSLGPEMLHSAYSAQTALVFDYDSDWALAIQPGNQKLAYGSHMIPWYASISAAHAGVDIVSPEAELSKYKAVFAQLQYVISEKQAANIRKYVEGGGIFVTSFRLGVKDESSRIVDAPLPGFLRDVVGVTLKDYVPVYNEKIGVQFSKLLAGPEGSCTLWADLLQPSSTSAEVLATYTGAYAGDAAITMNSFGKGKAVYIGADLDPMSLGRVLVTLLAANGVKSEFGVPRGVELTQRKTGNQEWTFLLNHTAAVQEVKLPGKFKDAVSGAAHEDVLHLEPYDARVLTRT